jgi:ABC-2 type transport system ATP-binding protein
VAEIRAAGRTVLFSTHQMEQAEKVVDSLCIIARGKKILDGNLRDIKRNWQNAGWIALRYAEDAKEAVGKLLADRALVVEQREAQDSEDDVELRPVDGVPAQQILTTLIGAGVTLRKFEVRVPSLHEIFVEKVGPEAAVAERREGDAA